MTLSRKRSFGERVWGGDQTTVDEARATYEHDPDRQLIPYASVLYSFRNKRVGATSLERLCPDLQERAKGLLLITGNVSDKQGTADDMDTIATHLAWLSYRQAFSFPERLALRKLAWEVAEKGYAVAAKLTHPFQKHTPLLLLLTQAELLMGEKLYAPAMGLLAGVAKAAKHASDPNQKARVYRKLGMLYRKASLPYGMPSRMYYGFWLILRAACLRGIPLNNRLKSMAAFVGFSR
ncbi:MAG TPA: hypothetical protein VGB97_02395 [Candidatus Paceibacterota bacterium]|jgi:hypothetical protein